MLALILLKRGQFDAVEHLLTTVNQNLLKEKMYGSIQNVNSEWCTLHHLLGCSLLAQARREASGASTEKKVTEAISCFFRAASLHGDSKLLKKLLYDSGFPHVGISDHVSPTVCKLHYYQWVMQIFEGYNMNTGAYQFALAALKHIDEVAGLGFLSESPSITKGRIWANVFKFSLDLNNYQDTYCAIISNPDEKSKYICLRRFVNSGAIKILCDGELPLICLAEKVEQELLRKAECSDVSVKPHPYKLLYAFETHQHKWRKAASYMYLYAAQLKSEEAQKDYSFALQERLNCLSATINALHLVCPTSAWIDAGKSIQNELCHSKKPDSFCMDIEKLENEYVLTSAEYLLSMANVKWTFTGIERPPSNLIELLTQLNLYDMVFTVILKFYKGSSLKGELERVFIAMSLKCCPSRDDTKKPGLLQTSLKNAVGHAAQHSKGNGQWDELKQYIEKYKSFHPRLPAIVAETLLHADGLIKLPLWLVQMFKGGTLKGTWGMAGSESSPALLFQLYVDYGRYAEATNLLLRYIEPVKPLRQADLIHKKKTFAMWFPYTTIERLLYKLGELINSGYKYEEQRSMLEKAYSTISKC